MSIKRVSDIKTFQEEVDSSDNILIKFEAEWCNPCKAMTPIVEDFAKSHPQLKVISVDIEGDGIYDVLSKYGVRSVPTFIRLKGGNTVRTATGTITRTELSTFAEG